MLQPQNGNMLYEHLFTYVDTGVMKIPMFQRDFVWDEVRTAKLIDSMIKGYPIGTFILWKTRDGIRQIKNIGNAHLPDIPKGDAALYVLDGQQRITSLYAVRKGATVTKEGVEKDYKSISIDLSGDPDGDEELVSLAPPPNAPSISVHHLMTDSVSDLARDYSPYLEKVSVYRERLKNYQFSVITLENYPIEVACEVFTRINTGGTELTLFEIMVAKTYSEERGFDLARECERLVNSNGAEKDLEDAGFDTIPNVTFLQCVAAHAIGEVRRQMVLKIDRDKFIDSWPVVKDGMFKAVDFVRTHLRVPVSRLLPYNTLLVPLTYFFIRAGTAKPTAKQARLLTQYFYWASLSNRFSSAVDSKVAQDLKRMETILAGEVPVYQGQDELKLTLDDLKRCWFSTGDAFCKAVLCLYAHFEPKSFGTDGLVKLDNSWLKVASSRNFHHFFPKSYLAKQPGYDERLANSILNITLVDEHLNKREIGAKAPSVYMKRFKKDNLQLDTTMRTHLIGDLDRYGVWSDDYEAFLEQRGKRVLAELNKRLNPEVD